MKEHSINEVKVNRNALCLQTSRRAA